MIFLYLRYCGKKIVFFVNRLRFSQDPAVCKVSFNQFNLFNTATDDGIIRENKSCFYSRNHGNFIAHPHFWNVLKVFCLFKFMLDIHLTQARGGRLKILPYHVQPTLTLLPSFADFPQH